jgi:hypothetical protein
MESFYWISLAISLIALLGVLTYIGVSMSKNRNTSAPYPPVASTCPDFWKTDTNKCTIPNATGYGVKNVGSIYDNMGNLQLNTNNTQGIDLSAKTIDFSTWSVCNKQSWANQNGLVWDGVTNYNSC